MKKRLVIVFWDLGVGGVQTRISAIVARIANTHPRARVELLLHKRLRNEVSIAAHPNVSVRAFPGPLVVKTRWFKKRIWRFTSLQFLAWLYFCLWRARPTHVLTLLNKLSFFIAVYVAAQRVFGKAPAFIINEPVVLSDYLMHHDPGWWRPLTSFSHAVADTVIVAANSVKNDLITRFRAAPKKIQIVRSWVPVKSAAMGNVHNKPYNGIYVGRLSAEKGIETVLETAAACKRQAKRRTFLIVGNGPLRSWLVREIKRRRLESHVSYFGYQKNPSPLIRRSRVLLLPSHNEGLPMAILEAYAMGVPVAVTPFPGAEEAVEHNKTGIIVRRSKYPDAVFRILGNSRQLERMGVAGQQKAKRDFSMKNLDRFIEAIFTPH